MSRVEDFLSHLVWIDRRPLLDVLPRRVTSFLVELNSGAYNRGLLGIAKKRFKSTAGVLTTVYRASALSPPPQGVDSYIVANDEGQAADDMQLLKRIVSANRDLKREFKLKQNALERRDGAGSIMVLPAGDVWGAHGKTWWTLHWDETHAYKNYDLFEALARDPTRPDALEVITSYASVHNRPGAPLHDFIAQGKAGVDPAFCFHWYSSTHTTDPELDDAEPWERAAGGDVDDVYKAYIEQQRRRLPAHKFRRLHLNEPGTPEGAAFNAERIEEAIATGRKRLSPSLGVDAVAFVDMSGGSSDDATLAIAHKDEHRGVAVLDLVMDQGKRPPFDPRQAIKGFAQTLKKYGVARVTGDRYAGETFRKDFERHGISYVVSDLTKHQLYESLEPRLNAREVELLDHDKLTEQLLGLVWRGQKIDHMPGEHDDHANAAAGAVHACLGVVMEDWDPDLVPVPEHTAMDRWHDDMPWSASGDSPAWNTTDDWRN